MILEVKMAGRCVSWPAGGNDKTEKLYINTKQTEKEEERICRNL